MQRSDCEIGIIGAGVAGLAAAARVAKTGKQVVCLEASDRIGGRIRTVHDPAAAIPIELGAEFVHGRPPEIWDVIRKASLTAYEHTVDALHFASGRVVAKAPVGEIADQALEKMSKSDRKKDESFEQYLRNSRQRPNVKKWARIQVEGFNAARSNVISAASLKQDSEAQDDIDGDRIFRLLNGYDAIPQFLLHSIPDHKKIVRSNALAKTIRWKRGRVEVEYEDRTLRCQKLIVTVPLGVLQRGAIHFDPEPKDVLEGARSLALGQVYRVTFQFREAFWDEDEKFQKIGFLVSDDKQFFTWWTTHPIISPVLTGWCGGSAAEQFRKAKPSAISNAALVSLARILNHEVMPPQAIYFHEWHAEPFVRGAYSYAPAGALGARKKLATPVDNTLFFAGEAAESKGHSGTVHGAIASGVGAANLALGVL